MITESELLNWGIKIGFQARKDKVGAKQLENLVASLESVEESNALLFTAVFAKRQASRKEGDKPLLSRDVARIVVDAMKYLHDRDAKRNEARKMLCFAKLVFEALEDMELPESPPNNLKELVEILQHGKRWDKTCKKHEITEI